MPEIPSAPTPMILPADPPAGAVPIEIPAGDPPQAALALLLAVVPDAPAVLASRIDAARAELSDLLESARLDPGLNLDAFLARASRSITLRSTLEERERRMAQGHLAPGVFRPGPPPAVELVGLVRLVSRWRDGGELRARRAQLVERIRSELAVAEADVANVATVIGSGSTLAIPPDQGHHRTGLIHGHDEALRRLETALTKRAALQERLDRLDPQGDAGRASIVSALVERSGGEGAIAEMIAPRMRPPALVEANRLRTAIAQAKVQMNEVDPETRRWATLSEQHDGLLAQLQSAQDLATTQRGESARSIVAAALTGNLAGVRGLEEALTADRRDLANALADIRGSDIELVATVAELTQLTQQEK
jgi:hypothetical protein